MFQTEIDKAKTIDPGNPRQGEHAAWGGGPTFHVLLRFDPLQGNAGAGGLSLDLV